MGNAQYLYAKLFWWKWVFLTYKKEGLYLNSRKGQTQIASSITKAVLEYKKKLDQNVGDYVFEDNEVNTDNDEVF